MPATFTDHNTMLDNYIDIITIPRLPTRKTAYNQR